jgi:PadR family transcriptional regulator, regulatory protein PadR
MASAACLDTPGKFAALSLFRQHLRVKGNLRVVNGGSAAGTEGSLTTYLLFSQRKCGTLPVGNQNGRAMKQKTDVLQGTLALMVLKTLDVLGPLHGYGLARRIEQISGDLLAVNQGTLYPVLLKLEQEGAIASEWGSSENNRRARFYRLTREGRKQLQVETQDWEQTAAIIGRFFKAKAEDLS